MQLCCHPFYFIICDQRLITCNTAISICGATRILNQHIFEAILSLIPSSYKQFASLFRQAKSCWKVVSRNRFYCMHGIRWVFADCCSQTMPTARNVQSLHQIHLGKLENKNLQYQHQYQHHHYAIIGSHNSCLKTFKVFIKNQQWYWGCFNWFFRTEKFRTNIFGQ